MPHEPPTLAKCQFHLSHQAQLEETGLVSSTKNLFSGLKIKVALYPDHVSPASQGFHTSHLLHVVIFSAVIWPDSVLQLSLSTSSSNLLKRIRAHVRAIARKKKKKKKNFYVPAIWFIINRVCVCVCMI